MEDTKIDCVTIVDDRVRRGRMQQLLKRIFALSIPGGECQGGACEEAEVVSHLEVPLLVLGILLPVPEEGAMGGAPEGLLLLRSKDADDSILLEVSASAPRRPTKAQSPLTCNHGVLLEHLAVRLHCSELLRKGLSMKLVFKAVIAVDIKAYVAVSSFGDFCPLLDEAFLTLWALEDWQYHGHVLAHPSLSNGVHSPGVIRNQHFGWHLT
mmetsp:Transcript_40240/g.93191  ORF Transcript_40240/g.93191 Transcript_40240/m.93191 type:complete len:210 (+) Transcript_40240:698-1327(+)